MVDIGSLIEQRSEIRSGKPCLRGTGVSVHRVVTWYQQGLTPEEIVDVFGHLDLAQVHAALSFYHANREDIDADLAEEAMETRQLQAEHRPPRAS